MYTVYEAVVENPTDVYICEGDEIINGGWRVKKDPDGTIRVPRGGPVLKLVGYLSHSGLDKSANDTYARWEAGERLVFDTCPTCGNCKGRVVKPEG